MAGLGGVRMGWEVYDRLGRISETGRGVLGRAWKGWDGQN
jgi:hypothetical protein